MTDYPNWFDLTAKNLFEKYLDKYKGVDYREFLQLGAFTGDASLWMLENILTGKYSHLIDVDTWGGSPGEAAHDAFNWMDVEAVYDLKLEKFTNRMKFKGRTSEFQGSPSQFDFIYIDAEHTAQATYDDAERSWAWLKRDGLLAFDDYEWYHPSMDPELSPKPGIERFLEQHKDELEVLEKTSQAWIRKL